MNILAFKQSKRKFPHIDAVYYDKFLKTHIHPLMRESKTLNNDFETVDKSMVKPLMWHNAILPKAENYFLLIRYNNDDGKEQISFTSKRNDLYII